MRKRGWMNIKNSKDRGAWAELCFAARAMEEALRPARPTGEPSGYDFLVHHKSTRIFRVQVKSTIYKMGRCYHCTIRTCHHVYKKDSFDFVAAYVIPEDVWYILPEKLIRGMSTVGLYPAMPGAKYDAYKEAWHLLRGESRGFVDRIEACVEEEFLKSDTDGNTGTSGERLEAAEGEIREQGSFDYACGFIKRIRMLRSG